MDKFNFLDYIIAKNLTIESNIGDLNRNLSSLYKNLKCSLGIFFPVLKKRCKHTARIFVVYLYKQISDRIDEIYIYIYIYIYTHTQVVWFGIFIKKESWIFEIEHLNMNNRH